MSARFVLCDTMARKVAAFILAWDMTGISMESLGKCFRVTGGKSNKKTRNMRADRREALKCLNDVCTRMVQLLQRERILNIVRKNPKVDSKMFEKFTKEMTIYKTRRTRRSSMTSSKSRARKQQGKRERDVRAYAREICSTAIADIHASKGVLQPCAHPRVSTLVRPNSFSIVC
jgi:hypothetical protein